MREVSGRGKPFEDVLRLVTATGGTTAASAVSGRDTRKMSVGPLPHVFTLGLAWDSARPSKEALEAVLERIDERIDVSRILAGVEGPKPVMLCGIVCYLAQHYIAIVRDPASSQWLHFDDSNVTVLGDSWVDVRFKCVSSRYQPALILYRQLAPNEMGPKEPDTPLPAGSSWATMATRCASSGGIATSASKPGVGVPLGGARATPAAVAAAKTAEAKAAEEAAAAKARRAPARARRARRHDRGGHPRGLCGGDRRARKGAH